jgi:hydrogenase-4 component F
VDAVLVLLVLMPAAAALASIVVPYRVAGTLTVVGGVLSLALVLALVTAAAHRTITIGFLRVDALSAVFLLATSFLYATTAVYSIGYLADEERLAAQEGGAVAAEFAQYSRRFFIGLNAFAWSMLCAPAANGLALLWIAIEITTVVSALLVAIDDTEGATEAAWKYVLIASSGLGIGLLATIVMYYAGSQVLGQSYDLAFDPLLAHAAALPATPVRLAFVLAVVGYGTKVGLFPVHTWLPDAHAEAPTPVSALLSGSLLATSFYAILRFFQVTRAAVGPHFPQTVLLVFGGLSLLLAALYVLEQSDVKRLLAYSSVEHMGILALGVGFGAPLAASGALLHVLAHAAGKGNAFMGAGVLVRKYSTKELNRIRGAVDLLPWSGPMFLASVFALSALPPFGLFRSEFEILAGGFSTDKHFWPALLIVLATLAFLGLTVSTTRMLFEPAESQRGQPVRVTAGAPTDFDAPDVDDVPERGEPNTWMVLPVAAGLVALLLLGLHPPAALIHLLSSGASQLTGG